MAYDETLAGRIRDVLDSDPSIAPHVSEQKMFGGLAFLLRGHLVVAASGNGGMLLRTDPETAERLLSDPSVGPMEMGGRSMRGWLRVASDALEADEQLESWIARGVGYVGTLPPKQ